MIKSIVDLSLRLTDLLEAEGRMAKAHAVHFMLSTLVMLLAVLMAVAAALILGAAGLMALALAGLSWPVALLIVAVSLLAFSGGVAVFGWFLLNRQTPVPPSQVPSTRTEATAPPSRAVLRGHAA